MQTPNTCTARAVADVVLKKLRLLVVFPAMVRLLASVVLALEACVGAAALSSGLTFHVYDNTALASPPVSTTVVEDAQIDIDASMDGSAELVGSITFPAAGTYEFTCTFENTTSMGMDWRAWCAQTACLQAGPRLIRQSAAGARAQGLTLPFRACKQCT